MILNSDFEKKILKADNNIREGYHLLSQAHATLVNVPGCKTESLKLKKQLNKLEYIITYIKYTYKR